MVKCVAYKDLHKKIKSLREDKGITQQSMADKLSMSRVSYIAIEQGKKDILLGVFEKIARILERDMYSLLGEEGDMDKYKQMFFEFLRVGTNNEKIPKTKLAKLLYLADFAWYYDHLESMSGMVYRKMQFGPVPKDYFTLVDEMEHQGLIDILYKDDAFLLSMSRSGKKVKTDLLKKKEKELIKDISKVWKHKKTKDIVSFTHNQLPYTLCDDNEIIPYELIIQEDPEHVY